ncbi:hypothetical protein [Tessaracoccus sp. ZS01]|nr:hypothetical protein [Tessaracoccus sp. ZS01]
MEGAVVVAAFVADVVDLDEPGVVLFHSAHVFSGIEDFNREPGLV